MNDHGGQWKPDALKHRWAAALKQAASTPAKMVRRNGRSLTVNKHGLSLSRLSAVPAHRLRSTFATMAGRLGVSDWLLKAYMGHAPGDVLGGHYRKIELAELRSVSDRIDGWKSLSVAGSSWQDPGIGDARTTVDA